MILDHNMFLLPVIFRIVYAFPNLVFRAVVAENSITTGQLFVIHNIAIYCGAEISLNKLFILTYLMFILDALLSLILAINRTI